MYRMELRANEKVLLITMRGLMTKVESLEYLEELKTYIRCINPKQYNVVIDTSELKTTPQNLIDLMEKAMEIITNTPFKKRYNIMPESIIAKSQVKRIAREYNTFFNTVYVNSYNEILDSIA